MAENKTQPTDVPVAEFLDAIPEAARREQGYELLRIFTETTGVEPVMWGPSLIGFGSYHYVSPSNPRSNGEWMRVGFSPRKAAISLYGLKDVAASKSVLPGLGTFKEAVGCLYVKRLSDISEDVLRELITLGFMRADSA
ncbi:MAG: DUF1801 domain-containing protein [Terrimesophilobacter sp.]